MKVSLLAEMLLPPSFIYGAGRSALLLQELNGFPLPYFGYCETFVWHNCEMWALLMKLPYICAQNSHRNFCTVQ